MLKNFLKLPMKERASSLVTTLMVIVVLTVIVVAFMQSMSIERMTSRSYANKYQAELAAEAGLQNLIGAISSSTTSNRFYLVSSTNYSTDTNVVPVLLLRQNNPTVLSNTVPLTSGNLPQYISNRFSNSAALGTFLSDLNSTNTDVAIDLNRLKSDSVTLIDSYSTNRKYVAGWQYQTNSSGTNISRFAYSTTDEQGKINVALSQGNSSVPRTNESIVDGSDIPVVGTAAAFLLSSSDLAALKVNATNPAFGMESMGQSYSSYSNFHKRKSFFSYLPLTQFTEEEYIPSGYTNAASTFVPYSDAGKPKYNINNLATNSTYGGSGTARATNLAAIINSNLPLYKLRDPSFSVAGDIRYIQRLAASMVDYIDTDSTTTQLPDGSLTEPAGAELQGVVLGVMERFRWISETAAPSGGWNVGILHSLYVQMWNPYQTDVSGTLNLEVETLRPVKIPGAIETPLDPVSGSVSVSLRPNEIKAFKITESTNTFYTPSPQPSSATANYPQMEQTSSTLPNPAHSRFKASWNGVLSSWTPAESSYFDVRGPGLEKSAIGAGTMELNGNYIWTGNFPQHTLIAGKGYRAVADPRQSFNENYVWPDRSVTSVTFGINGGSSYAITGNSTGQDYSAMWVGRDYLPFSPILGVNMSSATNEPQLMSNPYNANQATEKLRFPSVIRNDKMLSIGELGNIYDSASVNEIGIAAQGGTPAKWHISGGGRTLRIGQPEFSFDQPVSLSGSERRATNWNSPGVRSQHLMDLFSVANTNSAGIPQRNPRINVNTAAKEVLQTAFLNMQPVSDPTNVTSVITFDKAGTIADTIISNRPYINYSDFYKFLPALCFPTNFTPALGPTTFVYPTYLTNSTTVTQAMVADRAVEETFRRSVENLGITSKVLRVYVVGQSLGRNNKVQATSKLEAVLLINQVLDGANNYRLVPQVIYRKQL